MTLDKSPGSLATGQDCTDMDAVDLQTVTQVKRNCEANLLVILKLLVTKY